MVACVIMDVIMDAFVIMDVDVCYNGVIMESGFADDVQDPASGSWIQLATGISASDTTSCYG